MSTTKVILTNDKGSKQYEVPESKNAHSLLAKVASGRLTQSNAQIAAKLLASNAVKAKLQQFPNITVIVETKNEVRESKYNLSYLGALAELANSPIWDGVQSRLLKTNRGRRPSQKHTNVEIEL